MYARTARRSSAPDQDSSRSRTSSPQRRRREQADPTEAHGHFSDLRRRPRCQLHQQNARRPRAPGHVHAETSPHPRPRSQAPLYSPPARAKVRMLMTRQQSKPAAVRSRRASTRQGRTQSQGSNPAISRPPAPASRTARSQRRRPQPRRTPPGGWPPPLGPVPPTSAFRVPQLRSCLVIRPGQELVVGVKGRDKHHGISEH